VRVCVDVVSMEVASQMVNFSLVLWVVWVWFTFLAPRQNTI